MNLQRIQKVFSTALRLRRLSTSPNLSAVFHIASHDEFIQKVMNSPEPVIVNFHADWCEPCLVLTPKLEELIAPLKHIHLAKVDVESNADLVHTFEVKAIPAVLAVRNGLVIDKFLGLVNIDSVEQFVKNLSKDFE